MKTRSEAVKYFKSIGFLATERDWVMGETLQVWTHIWKTDDSPIHFLKNVIYLAPDNGSWFIHDFSEFYVSNPYKTLKEAVMAAETYLRTKLANSDQEA